MPESFIQHEACKSSRGRYLEWYPNKTRFHTYFKTGNRKTARISWQYYNTASSRTNVQKPGRPGPALSAAEKYLAEFE
jgi:hypothetical protein